MPDMTRRTLLTLGGAAGVIALAGPAGATTASTGVRRAAPVGSGIGLRSSFTGLIGRSFTVTNASGRHRLTLEKIDDVAHTSAGSTHSFNLIFRQTDGAEFTEGIYGLPTSWLGRTSVLLSPIGAAGKNRRIQALINRG